MRSGGLLIELGLSDNPLLVTLPHVLEHLVAGGDIALAEAVNVDALGDTLPYFEIFAGRINQVVKGLVVNLL